MSTRLYYCKLDVAVFLNFVLLRILESALKFLCPVPEEKYLVTTGKRSQTSLPKWPGKECMNNFHSRPIFDQPFRESLPNPKHPPYTYIAEVTRPKRLHQACNALLRDVGTAKEVQVGEPWTVRGKSLQGGVFHCAAQAEAEVGELCAGGGQPDYSGVVHLVATIKAQMP